MKIDFALVKSQLFEIVDLNMKKQEIDLSKYDYAVQNVNSLVKYATRKDLNESRIALFKKICDVVERHCYLGTQATKEMNDEIAALIAEDHLSKIDKKKQNKFTF